MTAHWEVVLSTDAARILEALPRAARRPLADALDALSGGLPSGAEAVQDAPGAWRIAVPGHALVVLPRDHERVMLVASITPREGGGDYGLPGGRTSRVVAWADDALHDLAHAARSLRRQPGFALSVLLTLALGIGGTTAIYSTLHAVYAAPLPFEDGDRLLRLRNFTGTGGGAERVFNLSPRDALLIREEAGTLDGVVAMAGYDVALVGDELPERLRAISVSPGWASVLGVEPVAGRTFSTEEEEAGTDAGVALLSHAVWQRRFGGDPSIVGATLSLDGGTLTVVGILPPRFAYPYDAELWTPFHPDPSNFTGHDLNVVGRMAPDASVEDVRAEMERLYEGLRATAPGTVVDDGVHVATLRSDFVREDGRIVQALLAAVGFLLLLACVNVANLLTARFVARHRELGIRAVLGAGQGRQLRQLLVETVALFALGGVLGLLVASVLADGLQALVPRVLRAQLGIDAGLGPGALGFAVGLSVVAGLVFGGAAALRAARTDLRSVMHEGGRGSSGRGGRFQDGLVVAELALSLVLLVGAGVMFQHFQRLDGRGVGFELDGLYTFRVSLEQERHASAEARGEFVRRLEEQLAAVPGVEAVGVTSVNPLCCGDWGASLAVEGLERSPDDPPILIHHRYATPAWFGAAGVPLLRGALFSSDDRPGSPGTVVVDEALAERFWPGQDPLGQRLRIDRPGEEWRTVVGVVGDVDEEGDYTETWYLPFYQDPLGRSNANVHVMLRASSEDALAAARRAVVELDPYLPTYEVTTMAALRDESLAQDRLGSVVSVAFAGFGVLLATFGLYGLLAYVVGLRTREMGTRVALGASRGEILGMVMRRAAGLVAVGAAVGLIAALFLNRVLTEIVPGVELAEPGLLAGLVCVLAILALAASAVPAARAARVDPVAVLQGE